MAARLRPLRALRRGKLARACRAEARRATAGGKSELRRAVRRVTPGQGNLKESGTENIPPTEKGDGSRFRKQTLTGVPCAATPENDSRPLFPGKGEKVR